ncbi:unnamed protein product [Pedinophyceae sp. YPF-701]|nr:unnamed protein product [Pedinophyceae sp. YPF-701]
MAQGGKSGRLLAGRIKKIMQQDEEVGKVAATTPVLMGALVEKLVEGLVTGAAALAKDRGVATVGAAHLKAHVLSQPHLDFLKDHVEGLPELTDKKEKKPRKRKAADADGGEGTDAAGSAKVQRGDDGGGAAPADAPEDKPDAGPGTDAEAPAAAPADGEGGGADGAPAQGGAEEGGVGPADDLPAAAAAPANIPGAEFAEDDDYDD